jgi:vitamin B12 transporter
LLAQTAINSSDSSYLTEEIKVTSFFNDADIFDSPSNIYSLNSIDIKNTNGNSLGDILQTVPGVFIKSYGGAGLQTISMNGLGAEHTVILLNGAKLNSLQNGQIDLTLVPKENIKRIEVLSNGYSSVYGSDAIGGVINIITDDLFYDEKLHLDLNTSIGSYDKRNIYVKLKNKIKNFNWEVLASNKQSDDNYDYYFHSGSLIELKNRVNSKYAISNYAVTFDYLLNKKTALKFYSEYINANREIPGIETGNIPPMTKQIDRNWNNILKIDFDNTTYSINSEFNFQNNLMNYSTLPVIDSYYKNIIASNLTRANFDILSQPVIFGTEVKYGTIQSDELDSNVSRKQFSVFNSSTINYKNLKFFPSIRYDHISDINKNVITYKLGINYHPFERYNLHLRGNISHNFSAPTFNALYWKGQGNKNLRPESSDNIELGFISSGKFLTDYIFDFTYLNILTNDRIIWLPQSGFIWRPVNILNSRSDIFISSLKFIFDISKSFNLSAGISYTHNKTIKTSENYSGDPTINKQIIYIPEEQVKSNIEFKFNDFGLNVFYSYLGRRYSDQENLNALSPASVIDGNIFYDLKLNGVEGQIKIELNNLTNTDYQVISGYPLPLRNYLLTFNLKYSL